MFTTEIPKYQGVGDKRFSLLFDLNFQTNARFTCFKPVGVLQLLCCYCEIAPVMSGGPDPVSLVIVRRFFRG